MLKRGWVLRHFAVACLGLGGVCIASCLGCNAKKVKIQTVQEEAIPVPVTVAAVEVRDVQRRVSVVGSLRGFEQVTVTPKVEGRVVFAGFDVGDRIPPGTTLLELDDTDYQLSVDEAQQMLEQELSRLDLTEPPTSEFDIEQLPSVQSARLLWENAERQFERQKKLSEAKAGDQRSLEQAETDLKVADAALRQARINARTNLSAVKHRETMLSLALQKLSETKVIAPVLSTPVPPADVSEFVVSQRMTSVGEMVRAFPSTPVYELIVDDVLKLHVMVPERYLSQVDLGMDVEVRVEAYPDEVFPGKVARISPVIDPQSRSFDVEAHVPNQEHRLRHGGFVKAEVVVGTADKAMTVPLECVTRFAGVVKVFRVRDDKAEEVEIAIGTQGSGWVEVTGGLDPNDIVVTSGQSKLANGTRVTIREPMTTAPKSESSPTQ